MENLRKNVKLKNENECFYRKEKEKKTSLKKHINKPRKQLLYNLLNSIYKIVSFHHEFSNVKTILWVTVHFNLLKKWKKYILMRKRNINQSILNNIVLQIKTPHLLDQEFFFSYNFIDTESWKLTDHIKISISGKYSYHKVTDKKHFGHQQNMKAVKSEQCYQMFLADWLIMLNFIL